ncbi:multicystatin-like [Haliotis rubra]|uniref:multicystatin-like n=1 Tax=Haliotis rubra TaxID=36100 RepID=UPI001EE56387|nr:multicystatin-like [Haliotis rubra]
MNILALILVVIPLAACQLFNGPLTVDVNRDDVQQMASFALTQLNTLLGSQNTLVSVVKAKTLVVAGINYFLTLKIKNGQETQICTVTVWSRVWLNDTQVTQHACTSRTKRDGLLGAPTSVNVTGQYILKMANYAVTTLNRLQGTVNSLDQVISAKTQVVAGTNYFLKIRMSDGSQSQICDVTILDQPWSYMTQLTHNSCVYVKKRDIAMPGGFTDVDVNSTGVRNMTNFALGEINKLFSEQLSLIEIISAKTQVVAGINYFLKFRVRNGNLNEICDVTIWEQLWTQTTHMTHSSCTSVASKRDILMPGGLTNVDINSTEVRDMASFALGEINGLQGAQNTMEQVISAKAQVVAGINYFLTLEIKNGQETQICTVTVWSRVWLNDKQVTQHACTSRAKRDGLLGAPTSVNVTGPDILKMATYAVTTLNGLQGTDNSLDQVISAKIQVVAGTNYFLKIRVSDGSQTQICDVTIWDQPWSYMTQLTHHSCVDVKKRDIAMPGGFTDVDVNSTGVRNMTNFALGEINKLFSEQLSLIEIISAKTQVVAGINYFLKFRVRNGNLNEICDVTISEQLWTQATKMTHSSCTSVGSKRDILMPGGLTNVDINSTEVRDMASFALGEINGLQGAQNTMEQVISAKAQVVSGMNYMLTIRLKEGYKTQICYVKIWSQPWLHRKEMTEHSCSQVTKRAGGLLGGPTGVDVNSAEIQEVANFAVTEINGIQGAQNSLVKVVNARKQIVSGINYILTLNLQNGDKRMTCRVAVLYQAWSDPKFQLLSDTCGQLA